MQSIIRCMSRRISVKIRGRQNARFVIALGEYVQRLISARNAIIVDTPKRKKHLFCIERRNELLSFVCRKVVSVKVRNGQPRMMRACS